jgi:uncharacterized BrkB/YihY/UPF0761 family membrane protein
VVVLSFLPFIPDQGLHQVWDRTLGYQLGRDSPFSIWGQNPGLEWLWTAVKVAALALAMGVAFVPRRKTPVQVAALGAAVLVAFQLTASHWFYLYIVWFLPFALVAFFCRYVDDDPAVGVEARALEQPTAELAVA